MGQGSLRVGAQLAQAVLTGHLSQCNEVAAGAEGQGWQLGASLGKGMSRELHFFRGCWLLGVMAEGGSPLKARSATSIV